MSAKSIRIATVGIGWWSDVLADAAGRTGGRVEIASCFTRSADKRQAFAAKYRCRAAASLVVARAGQTPSVDGESPFHSLATEGEGKSRYVASRRR